LWFDILVFDKKYGWLPVNIKTTTTITSDNTGNLAMCVWAYTNTKMDLNINKTYKNGLMSKTLINKIINNEYNLNRKRDYYFIVFNKTNNNIIVNSIKGLIKLTPNCNNLPFQVNWSKNQTFKYDVINKKIKLLLKTLQKPQISWKEVFMSDVRKIKI
jgi:hypothetical protein